MVHWIIEQVVQNARNMPATPNPIGASVANLGGLREITDRAAEFYLGQLAENPRVADFAVVKARLLREQRAVKETAQKLLSRIGPLPIRTTTGGRARGGDFRIRPGHCYTELWVESSEVGWKGIIDLVAVEDEYFDVTDFKTGQPSPDDLRQAQIYAVTLANDKARNPQGLSPRRLRLIYPDSIHEVIFSDESVQQVIEYGDKARALLAANPERAALEVTTCARCHCRPACTAYWESPLVERTSDFALLIGERTGDKTWRGTSPVTGRSYALWTTGRAALESGRAYRILEGYVHEAAPEVVRATWRTEIYDAEKTVFMGPSN